MNEKPLTINLKKAGSKDNMKIMAIGAHLDDIELACGGTISKAIKLGHSVKMVIMSDSSYTNFDGKVLRTKEEAEKEGREAAAKIGVKDLVILNFSTKDVPYHSTTVEAIDQILNEYKPDTIFTHWPFDTHQAHRNSSLASISAGRNFNSIFFFEPFPPSGRSYVAFRPQVYVDITDTLDDKVESMKAHKSQHAKYGEDWVEAIVGRARMRGFECGKKYAEVFETLRMEMTF